MIPLWVLSPVAWFVFAIYDILDRAMRRLDP
jgi:hypothetical protein